MIYSDDLNTRRVMAIADSWQAHILGVYYIPVGSGLSSEVCFVSARQHNAGPLGHWLACGLVIMGELVYGFSHDDHARLVQACAAYTDAQ